MQPQRQTNKELYQAQVNFQPFQSVPLQLDKICVQFSLTVNNQQHYHVGHCLAQLVERASHVLRLCSRPRFDSRPGPVVAGHSPSLSPCFLSYLQLYYQ